MGRDDLAPRVQAILDVPLHRHLGLVFDGHENGAALAHFDVGPAHVALGGLHGGVLYALFDAVAMLALLPSLDASRHAVTHDLHVSMLSPVPAGARCRLEARVVRLGRSLAFLDAAAKLDDRLVATARVTKSLTGPR